MAKGSVRSTGLRLRQTLTLRHGFTVFVRNYGTLGLWEADTRYVLFQWSGYACMWVRPPLSL